MLSHYSNSKFKVCDIGSYYLIETNCYSSEKVATVSYGGQYSIVNSEMNEIDKADIVCLDFTKPHAIATIAELFYSLKQNKEIHIFIDPTLTNEQITSEYWFIFYTMDRMYGADYNSIPTNVTRHFVRSEEEIVGVIKSL